MQSSSRKRNLTRDAKDENPLGQSPIKKPNTPKKNMDNSLASLGIEFSADFANKSWADMVEEENNRLSKSPARVIKSPKKKLAWEINSPKKIDASQKEEKGMVEDPELPPLGPEYQQTTRKSSRKAATPKKVITQPKFAKSLALTEAFNNRRSERILRLELEKKRSEKQFIPKKLDKIFKKDIINNNKKEDTTNLPTQLKEPNLRKRHVSGDSMMTINSSISSPFAQGSRVKYIPNKSARLHTPDRNSLTPNPLKDWEAPKNGWCTDEAILLRRSKEIQKTQDKEIYKRYIREVPKHTRKKNTDPKTPNKYLNFSRRSWDMQIKKWKLKLYEWAGEEPSSSTNTSYCSSEVDYTENLNFELIENKNVDKNNSLKKVSILENPEAIFSMMGHFDMESRRGFEQDDESTLKGAPTISGNQQGPTDFKQLKS